MDASHLRSPSPTEMEALAEITATSFLVSAADIRRSLERLGSSSIRAFVEGGEVVGGLVSYRMGQWFGGRSVPAAGIALVSTAPVARGRGSATRMMRLAMAELAAEGLPLATLYPAAQSLYRRAGFERAGSRFEIRVPTTALALGDHGLSVRAARTSDDEAIAELYQRQAQGRPGFLDRSPIFWERLREPRRDPPPTGYVIERGDRIEGYCYLAPRAAASGRQELYLSDWATSTPQAATRLLSFLGDHGSLLDDVVWYGSANEPLLTLLAEQRYQMRLQDVWMLRILNVATALTARGYPPSLETQLELQIDDELLPANAGRYLVEISGGSARVRPGGAGLLRLHARGLAPLYTGYLSPADLCLLGLAEGPQDQLDRALAAFSGPPPTIREFF